jgi:cytochrome P450
MDADVIGEVTFSKRFGFMESGKDDGAFAIIENSLRSAAWSGYVPWIYWLNARLTPIIGNRLAVTARQGSLLKMAAAAIAERKERGSSHADVLAQFFDIQKQKPIFDDISLTSQVSSNIFAGSDSTAISLSAMLLYLLKNPEKKKILLAEIEAMAQKNNVKQYGIFSLEMANDMPYLQAVMWEAMRLHPAIGMNIGRRVPQGGVTIDGRYYPEGVRWPHLTLFLRALKY